MRLNKPSYYDEFHCLAGACPDSCCRMWEVDVDEETAAYYRTVPGELGDRLRRMLRQEDGTAVITFEDGHCPLWQKDGLCHVQAELGEKALCRVCREYPRLRHDFGDFVELGLELSCPEACRVILHAPAEDFVTAEIPQTEQPDYDQEAMTVLQATRKTALELLSQEDRPVGQSLAMLLLFGCEAQSALDGGELPDFDMEHLPKFDLVKQPQTASILPFFQSLEILTPQWAQLLREPVPSPWMAEHLAMARYLVQRYWLQAVSDYDLYSRVKFIVVSCLTVKTLGGDVETTAQLYSKEIENSTENVDALLDAAYEAPVFTDDRLLGMLL